MSEFRATFNSTGGKWQRNQSTWPFLVPLFQPNLVF